VEESGGWCRVADGQGAEVEEAGVPGGWSIPAQTLTMNEPLGSCCM